MMPTSEQATQAVIFYAEYDSYLPLAKVESDGAVAEIPVGPELWRPGSMMLW
jgi:hypothetical protein